jgi:hypothetical protein
MLSQKSYAGAEIGFGAENLAQDHNSSKSASIGANWFSELSFGFGLDIGFSAQYARFNGIQPLHLSIEQNQALSDAQYYDCLDYTNSMGSFIFSCPIRRKDRTLSLYAALFSTTFNWSGLFPSVRYTYITRKSNMDEYAFNRHRVELLASYRF